MKNIKATNILLGIITTLITIIGYFYVLDRNSLAASDQTTSKALTELLKNQNSIKLENTKEHEALKGLINTSTSKFDLIYESELKPAVKRSVENDKRLTKVETKIGIF